MDPNAGIFGIPPLSKQESDRIYKWLAPFDCPVNRRDEAEIRVAAEIFMFAVRVANGEGLAADADLIVEFTYGGDGVTMDPWDAGAVASITFNCYFAEFHDLLFDLFQHGYLTEFMVNKTTIRVAVAPLTWQLLRDCAEE